jgi:hypothetical protein
MSLVLSSERFVDLRALSHGVATAGFLTLFPLYLIYHYLLVTEVMPPVLGGLSGNVGMLLSTYCIFFGFWLLRDSVWGGLNGSRLFLLVWFYCAAWSVVGAFTVLGETWGFYAVREAVAMLVYWMAMFFVGSFFRVDGPGSKPLFVACACAMFGVLAMAMITNRSVLGPFILFNPVTDADVETATYQGAGRSVLITAIVAAALAASQGKQLGIMVVAVIALISLGSRTYLVTGATSMLLLLLLSALRRKQHVGLIVSLGAVVAVAYVALPILLLTRAGELFDLGRSSSWNMRGTLQENALDAIQSNPLLGDFAYHIREIAPGGYAHNALSAWTEFGLVGFVLYCALLLHFLITALRHAFSPNPLWQAAVGLNSAAILIVNAEPVFSLVPPLAWGVVVNAQLQERRERGRLRVAVPLADTT